MRLSSDVSRGIEESEEKTPEKLSPDDVVNNNIDKLFGTDESKFNQSAFLAKDVPPEQATESFKLSKKYNVPAHFVQANLDSFKDGDKKDPLDYKEVSKGSKVLAKYLENPIFAAMSKDDLEVLTQVTNKAGSLVKDKDDSYPSHMVGALETGTQNLSVASYHLRAAMGMGDIEDFAQDIADINKDVQDKQKNLPEWATKFNETMESSGDNLEKSFTQFKNSYDDFADGKILDGLINAGEGGFKSWGNLLAYVGEFASHPKGASKMIAESAAFSFPSIALGASGAAAGFALGPVGATAGFVGGSFAGSTMTETGAWINSSLSERGFDITNKDDIIAAYKDKELMSEIRAEAVRKGVTTGAVDALFNSFGGKFLKGAGKGVKAKAIAGAKDLGVQSVGEGIGEFSGQAAAYKDVGKASISESVLESLSSFGQSIADTAIGASINKVKGQDTDTDTEVKPSEMRSEFSESPVAAAKEIALKAGDAQETLQDLETLEKLGQLAEESRLQDRSEEAFSELIDQVTPEGETQKVFFQKNEWDQFWTERGESPVQKAEELLSLDSYNDAQEKGSELVIPTKEFVSRYAGDGNYEQLLKFVRTKPDGMKLEQATQISKELPALMNQVMAEAKVEKKRLEKEEIEFKEVKTRLEKELVGSGRKKIEASFITEFYKSTAAKLGMTPTELANKYPLTINQDLSGEGGISFNQEITDEAQRADIFHSKLNKEIQAMDFKKVPAKDLLNRIKKMKGIKKEELEYLGIEEYLNHKGDEKLTKEELEEFINNNGIKIVPLEKITNESQSKEFIEGENYYIDEDGVPTFYRDDFSIKSEHQARDSDYISRNYPDQLRDFIEREQDNISEDKREAANFLFGDTSYGMDYIVEVFAEEFGLETTLKHKELFIESTDENFKKAQAAIALMAYGRDKFNDAKNLQDIFENWDEYDNADIDEVIDERAANSLYDSLSEHIIKLGNKEIVLAVMEDYGRIELESSDLERETDNAINDLIYREGISSVEELEIQLPLLLEEYGEIAFTDNPISEIQEREKSVGHSNNNTVAQSSSNFSQYTVDGDQIQEPVNYREVLLTMPQNKNSDEVFVNSSHFKEGNVLAHIRMSDKVGPNGERILFAEEFQSDWHQAGREKGYQGSVPAEEIAEHKAKVQKIIDENNFLNINQKKDYEQKFPDLFESVSGSINDSGKEEFIDDIFDTLISLESSDDISEYKFDVKSKDKSTLKLIISNYFAKRYEEIKTQIGNNILVSEDARHGAVALLEIGTVPDAPFKQTDAWVELSLKRLLRMAAEENYDSVSWTPASVHQERWGTDTLAWKKSGKGWVVDSKEIEGGFADGIALEQAVADRGDLKHGQFFVTNREELLKAVQETLHRESSDRALESLTDRAWKMMQDESGETGKIEPRKEGMENFYNRMVPKVATKLAKKIKSKPQVTEIKTPKGPMKVLEIPLSTEAKDKMLSEGFSLFQEERGKITRRNNKFNIELFATVNNSTFIHEAGHYFLEIVRDLAVMDNASQEFKDDYKVILDWFGVESGDQIETEHHEMFARAWEKYSREGKSPSKALRKLFDTFKLWLTNVYKNAEELNVDINDELRSVFDRMLTSRDESKKAIDGIASSDLFLAMPPGLQKKYQAAAEEFKLEAEEELLSYLNSFDTKVKRAKSKILRNKIRKEETEKVNKLEVYNNISLITKGKFADGRELPEGTQAPKIDFDDAKLRFSEIIGMPNFKGAFSKIDGLSIEAVAAVLRYDDVDAMVTDFQSVPVKSQAISLLTEQRFQDTTEDMLNDPDLTAKAEELAHNDQLTRMVRMEYEFIASNNKGLSKEITRQTVKRPAPQKQIKELAEAHIDNMLVKDIRPHVFKLAFNRHRKESGVHLANGDFRQINKSKEKELLNLEMYKLALKAKEFQKKKEKDIKKFFKADKDLAKTRDLNLINTARAVLSRYGMGRSNKEPLQYLAAMKDYNPEAYENMSAIITQVINDPDDYNNIEYSRFKELIDTVQTLWDMSKDIKSIEVRGQKFTIEKAVDELIEQSDVFRSDKVAVDQYQRSASDWDKMRSKLLSTKSYFVRKENWIDMMDMGNINGPFRKFIYQSLSDANVEFLKQNKKYKQKFIDLSQSVKDSFIKDKEIKVPELGFAFRDKGELLGALLHIGNSSNKKKLLVGRGWGSLNEDGTLNDTKWKKFMDRAMADGTITKLDMDYIQSLWDLMDEIKPMAQRAYKKVFGYYFSEITADEISTPFGKYKGGYAPAMVDPSIVKDVARRADLENFIKSHNTFTYPAAGGSGFGKNRVENYNKPLNIDINMVASHIETVLKFSTIKPAAVDALKITMNEGFKNQIDQIDDSVITGIINPAINRADKNSRSNPGSGVPGSIVKGLKSMQGLASMQFMFLNIKNIAEQVAGFSTAATRIKGKYLRSAGAKVMTNHKEMTALVRESSPFMQTRDDEQIFEIDAVAKDVFSDRSMNQKTRDWAKKNAYIGQILTQNLIEKVVWIGAYDEGIANGMSHEISINKADADIRITQGSRRGQDIASVEANEFLGFFNMFYNFFNTMANLNAGNFKKLYYEDLSLKQKFGRGMYLYMMGYASIAVISEALSKLASGGLDEDEDGEYADDLYDVFIQSQVDLGLAMIPGLGGALNAGLKRSNDVAYDDRVSASPALSVISTAAGVASKFTSGKLTDDKGTKSDVKDVLTTLGLITGTPIGALGKPVGYLMDVNEGKAKPSGPIDAARGIITGRPGVK